MFICERWELSPRPFMTEADNSFGGALSRTFFAVLLLTGSVEQSESALVEGIGAIEGCETPADELLRNALQAACNNLSEGGEVNGREFENAASLLPPELERVLRLPQKLRHCFTLRTLAGLPASACERILKLGASQVDAAAAMAAERLVDVCKHQTPFHHAACGV